MKLFFLTSIITLSFTVLPADAGFLKRKKKVVKTVNCPIAVVEGIYVDENCQNSTRVCPIAVEQSSLLHPACQGLSKKCPSTNDTIPPGCSRITNLTTGSSTGSSSGGNVIDLANANWGCTTDKNGIGTCQTQEECTVENNVKRCTKCTQTISVQADDGISSGSSSSGSSSSGSSSSGSSSSGSTGSVQ